MDAIIALNVVVIVLVVILVGALVNSKLGIGGLAAAWFAFCLSLGLSAAGWFIYVAIHFITKVW